MGKNEESVNTQPPPRRNSKLFGEVVLELERQVDVNAIQIEDVHLWPLIRGRLRKPFKVVAESDNDGDSSRPRRERVGELTRIVRGIPGAKRLRALLAGEPARKAHGVPENDAASLATNQLARLRGLGTVDFLVFSRPNKYYQSLSGGRYAPVLDPVFEDLGRRGRAAMLCEGTPSFDCINTPADFDIAPYMSVWRKGPKRRYPEAVQRMQPVVEFLAAHAPEFELEPEKVIYRYSSHAHRRQFYLELLDALEPKVVFFSSFTSWMPLSWACREMGIPTVDIQHGGQTAQHGFNTHYSCVPPQGYHFLPDFFWCWGYPNRDIVAQWFPGGACRHVPLVGGNRWKAKLGGAGAKDLVAAPAREFLEDLERYPIRVLVTLSHGIAIDEILPAHLLEAMARRPGWFWMIRMHPINREPTAVQRLHEIMEQHGRGNWDIRHSTELPLPLLLNHVQHHLTPYSTAAREAVDFGVPTTIIDPVGRMDFLEEIEAGEFGYAQTTSALIAAVEAPSTPNGRSRDGRFLETDDALVDQLLARVLDGNADSNAPEA